MSQHPRTQLFIGFLLLLTVLLGYNYFAQPFATQPQPQPSPTTTPEQPDPPSSTEAVFNQLSPIEKINQMLAVPLVVSDNSSINVSTSSATISAQVSSSPTEAAGVSADWVEINNPGFLLVFGEAVNKSRASKAVSTYRSLPLARGKSLQPAIVVDHEGGEVQRLSGIGYTKLPSWRQLCGLNAVERTELLQESSNELRETGVDVVLAPVLDLSASNFVLGQRTCSNDPSIVASRSAEFSQEFLANDITPVFKHFPGIGSVTTDLHSQFARTEVSNEASTLYRDLLSQFPGAGVLITHVGVSNSQEPSQPCSLSSDCVSALRRYFPSTLTFTDSLTMDSASYTATGSAKPLSQISQEAVTAGNDVLIFDQQVNPEVLDEIVANLVSQYHQDQVFADQVDESVQRIIWYKQQNNLLQLD